MFKFLFLFSTVLVAAELLNIPSEDDSNWMELKIRQEIEKNRHLVPDPWEFADFDTRRFGDPYFNYVFGFSSCDVAGISNFEIQKVSFDLSTFEADIQINYPEILSSCTNNIYVDFHHVKHHAIDSAFRHHHNITNFSYRYQYRLVNGTDGRTYTKDSRVTPTFGNINLRFSGFVYGFNFGQTISEFITNYAAEYINGHQKIISDIISPLTQFIVDVVQYSPNRLQ